MPLPTFEYTAVITPEHIYPDRTAIPGGYRVRGFRVPAPEEHYLNIIGYVCICNENQRWANTNPRLILEKIPRKRYIFEPVEVTPDTAVAYVRHPVHGSLTACTSPYDKRETYDQFYSLREEEF